MEGIKFENVNPLCPTRSFKFWRHFNETAIRSQMPGVEECPKMNGYLYKKAKTGKWQLRWFETNANFLTYYKTNKTEKLLAALNLPHVRAIKLVDADMNDLENDGALFTIELNTRTYIMKATTREEASKWVDTLVLLQSLDPEVDSRSRAESPRTKILMPGSVTEDKECYWRKGSGCFGLCGCFGLR